MIGNKGNVVAGGIWLLVFLLALAMYIHFPDTTLAEGMSVAARDMFRIVLLAASVLSLGIAFKELVV